VCPGVPRCAQGGVRRGTGTPGTPIMAQVTLPGVSMFIHLYPAAPGAPSSPQVHPGAPRCAQVRLEWGPGAPRHPQVCPGVPR
ncbi:hypothetical protein DV515_00019542, partial [Chloebia gouldiae]